MLENVLRRITPVKKYRTVKKIDGKQRLRCRSLMSECVGKSLEGRAFRTKNTLLWKEKVMPLETSHTYTPAQIQAAQVRACGTALNMFLTDFLGEDYDVLTDILDMTECAPDYVIDSIMNLPNVALGLMAESLHIAQVCEGR